MSNTQNEWWSTGYEELETLDNGDSGDRHYMKPGQDRNLLFIDGSPDDKERFKRPYGSPFCFPAGQLVTTERGQIPIEDVIEGDRVLRADGTLGKVVKTMSRSYTGDMVTILPKKRSDPIVATAGHKIRVLESQKCVRDYRSFKYTKWCSPSCNEVCTTHLYEEYRIANKDISEVVEGDYVVMPGLNPSVNANIEAPTIVGPDGKQMILDETLAWLLGTYAAEGHNHGGPTWTLHEKEKDFAEAITDSCVALFSGKGVGTLNVGIQPHPDSKAVQHVVYGKRLGEWFEETCGKYAANKRLPGEVVFGPPQIQAAALSGLLEGDGCTTIRDDGIQRIDLGVVSPHLAYQANLIALNSGLRPGIYTHPAKSGKDGISRQKIYCASWAIKNKVSHGMMFENGIGENKAPLYAVRIKSGTIEEVQGVTVYNITVENDGETVDPHSYTVNGFGVSNCFFEYQIPTKGDSGINWRNWATCVRGRKDADGNPMRDYVRENAPDLKPYYVGMYTVYDVSKINLEEVVQAGDALPDSCRRVLLPAKRKLLPVLKRHADKRGGLRGCVYTVYRGDPKSASTGDDWQFETKLTEDQMKALFPTDGGVPMEYAKILAPLPEEEVKGLLAIRTKVSKFDDKAKGDSGSGSWGGRERTDSEESVPF